MRARIWGCRGSLATPGAATGAYGGNTSCVEVRTGTDSVVVLDAGTGIRALGETLRGVRRIDLLLTHLHLDHIEGLGFFAPLHDAGCEVTVWGPSQADGSLSAAVATWLSPPYYPVPFERLEARVEIRDVQDEAWSLGGVRARWATVSHPGPTVGYRLEADGATLVYIPDNEAARDAAPAVELARGADVLLHDAQYTADEYRTRVGWGHSSVADFAAVVAQAAPARALMFHHDPAHDDATLEAMRAEAAERAGADVELARDGLVIEL